MEQAPKAYATDDFSLAVTLWVLAMQMVNHKGQPAGKGECPEWKQIESKDLDKLGIDFEEAVKRGMGEIAYGFAYHDKRQLIIDTFRKAREAAKTGNTEIPDTFKLKCECGKDCTLETVELLSSFAAYLFAARKYFADRRPKIPAKLRVQNDDGSFDLIDPRHYAND